MLFKKIVTDERLNYFKKKCDEKYMNKSDVLSGLIDSIYPIGSIVEFTNDVDPNVTIGGTWERMKGTFLYGADTLHELGSTGGSRSVKLSVDNMPNHSHDITHAHSTPSIEIQGGSHIHDNFNTISGTMNIRGRGDAFMVNTSTTSGVFSLINESSSCYQLERTDDTNRSGYGGFKMSATPSMNGESGNHKHTIPQMTTNSQNTTTSGSVGKGQEINIEPKFTAVNRWYRVA